MNLAKRLFLSAATGLLLLCGAAFAHEAKPMHDGIVTEINEVQYELVAKPDVLTLYVRDEDKPVDVKGGAATLVLMTGSEKTEVKLLPAGGNKLEARGKFRLRPGTKIAASVTAAGKTVHNVKFKLH
jgi:hypothetical protein